MQDLIGQNASPPDEATCKTTLVNTQAPCPPEATCKTTLVNTQTSNNVLGVAANTFAANWEGREGKLNSAGTNRAET